MKMNNLFFTFLAAMTLLISCGNNDDDDSSTSNRNFDIYKVLEDDTTKEMHGTNGLLSLTNFNSLTTTFTNVSKINIKNCDGSSDDSVNLQLSLKVHQKKNIHLMENGEIASGGVDFFLSGVQRIKGTNTKNWCIFLSRR
jgi:hypothetical protein